MATLPLTAPVFMETPADAVRHVERETIRVEDRSFLIDRPARSDKLLDEPAVLEANVRDDYMPYWADIWPAARMMAKVIVRSAVSPQRKQGSDADSLLALRAPNPFGEVLELGCGLGLGGIAALSCGYRVIFSDYDLTALRFAERNARLNGFTDFRTMALDWRFPPDDLKVPLILAADLTYEMRNIDPLIALIQKVLLPGGTCLLTDPDRTPAPHLRERLSISGLTYSTEFIRAGEPGGLRIKGTLYRIQKATS